MENITNPETLYYPTPKPKETTPNKVPKLNLTAKTVQACPACNKTLLSQKKEDLWRCFTCKRNIKEIIERPSQAKGTRRNTENLEIIKRDELIRKLATNPDQQANTLIAILYLSAARISEVLTLTKEQISIDNLANPDKPILYIKNRPILKKRKFGKQVPKHTVPIHISQEPELANIIIQYAKSLPDGSKLFDFNRQKATTIIQKTLGKQYFIHWLRHSRITDMFLRKKWPEQVIVKYLKWSDSRQFERYTHLKGQELAELTED
jgi:integrase